MKSTEIIRRINRVGTPQEAWNAVNEQERLAALGSHLSTEVLKTGVSINELAAMANVERTALYHIMEGKQNPSRNTLLRIAFALRMKLEQVQALLKHGGKSALTPRTRRDTLLIFCLQRQYALVQAEAVLRDMREASLYGRS